MKKNVSIPAPKSPLSIEVVIVDSGSTKKTSSHRIAGEARTSAKKLGFTRGTISIVLVSRSRMRLLNLKFRGKKNATDVLAFPYIVKKDSVVADIMICPNVIRERLARYGAHGKNFYSGLAFIVAHAMVHLKGFDHKTSLEAQRMDRKVQQLLAMQQ